MLIDFGTDFADLLVKWSGSRAGAGSDNAEGVFLPGVAVPFAFMAVPPQPMTMNELQMEEGGEFVRSLVKTYTPYALQINDVLTFRGISYEVHRIDDRQPLGRFLKVTLRKVQNDN